MTSKNKWNREKRREKKTARGTYLKMHGITMRIGADVTVQAPRIKLSLATHTQTRPVAHSIMVLWWFLLHFFRFSVGYFASTKWIHAVFVVSVSLSRVFFLSFCHADHPDFGRSNFFEWNVAHAIFSLCLFIISLRFDSVYLPTIWSIASVAYQDSYLSFCLLLSLFIVILFCVWQRISCSHRSLCVCLSLFTWNKKTKKKHSSYRLNKISQWFSIHSLAGGWCSVSRWCERHAKVTGSLAFWFGCIQSLLIYSLIYLPQ